MGNMGTGSGHPNPNLADIETGPAPVPIFHHLTPEAAHKEGGGLAFTKARSLSKAEA
jgi:hypothetical protein